MVSLTELWQPIVLATLVAFLAGTVLHMVLPHHKSDWKSLPDEAGVLAAMRRAGVGPGMYFFPFCPDMKQMNSPEYLKKQEDGPCGIMTVRPSGRVNMGSHLAKQFGYHLVVSIFIAYLAGRTLGQGTEYLRVFQVSGTAAVLAYAGAVVPSAIWYGQSFRFTLNQIFDGVVWGLVTAGSFGWLWPR